jgi:hypothetical protein
MSYKIKISCTKKEELCYNNNKISKPNSKKKSEKDYDKLKYELKQLVNNYNYINSSLILYKKFETFTTKTLEFLCNKEITEDDFKYFIKNMHDIGFFSGYNTKITFVKLDKPNNESANKHFLRLIKKPILTYLFQSITKIEEEEEKKRRRNNSTYHTQILYTK